MITAAIFDLCSTLIETDRLKALSYARAASELQPDVSPEEIVAFYQRAAGLPRHELAVELLARFGLEPPARNQMTDWDAHEPWQAFARLRSQYYRALLESPDALRRHCAPHVHQLLETVRMLDRKLGLVTMTRCDEAVHMLRSIGLAGTFDAIVARDDVERHPPDPEIFLLAARHLNVAPDTCLVAVGASDGVRAARSAGMQVIATVTPYNQKRFEDPALLSGCRQAHGHDQLARLVTQALTPTDEDGIGPRPSP